MRINNQLKYVGIKKQEFNAIVADKFFYFIMFILDKCLLYQWKLMNYF